MSIFIPEPDESFSVPTSEIIEYLRKRGIKVIEKPIALIPDEYGDKKLGKDTNTFIKDFENGYLDQWFKVYCP